MSSSIDRIRRVVHDAARRRRRQDVTRAVARLAPALAGAALVIALVVRLAGGPPVVSWVLAGVMAAGLALYAWLAQRVVSLTDATAARIDRDAALDGELRSAYWFTAQPAGDAWTDFHLEGAAARIQSVAWQGLYPPVRAPRAWIATALLTAGAVTLILLPARVHLLDALTTRATPGRAAPDPSKLLIPEDLRKKLEALLAGIESGAISAEQARGQVTDLRDLLAKLDASAPQGPGKGAPAGPMPNGTQTAHNAESELAKRAERAANSKEGLPQDLKWSLEDLAAKLAAAPANREGADKNPSASNGEPGQASAQAEMAASANLAQASMQVSREAASDPGPGQMMMAGGGLMGGDSRPGRGGNSGARGNPLPMLDIQSALKRETVEASMDTTGANVNVDIRRKTEQGRSTLGFTHAAPTATFDRSRAVAPAPVPDARRLLLQQYFIRRQ